MDTESKVFSLQDHHDAHKNALAVLGVCLRFFACLCGVLHFCVHCCVSTAVHLFTRLVARLCQTRASFHTLLLAPTDHPAKLPEQLFTFQAPGVRPAVDKFVTKLKSQD